MIKRIVKSLNYRSTDLVYYNENKSKIGISKADFFGLKKQGNKANVDSKVHFFGKKIGYTSPFWFLHSLDEIFVEEVYNFESPKANPRILDVGANIGLSIIYFKQKFPNASIIGFEPDPEIFAILKSNIKAFEFTDIDLIQRAAWVDDSELTFEPDGILGGQLSAGIGEADLSRKIIVKTIRLKEYLAEPVDFLKIDIEGAEVSVIQDCADSLGMADKLFIEYHLHKNEKAHLHKLLSLLSDAGFNYYIREAWPNKKFPFIEESAGKYDMQLNIFCNRE